MRGQQIRLAILLVIGVIAVFAGKPVMTYLMLMQENQKAKIVTPPPDYIPPITPGGASMPSGPGDAIEEKEEDGDSKAASDVAEPGTEEKPTASGESEGS